MAKSESLSRRAAESVPLPPFHLAGALLLAGLTTALVAIGAGLLGRVLPGWQPAPLIIACFLVAMEAALVRYRMQLGRHLELGALGYLAAELFALAVLMRAVPLAWEPDPPGIAGSWIATPLAALDLPFVACFCLGLLIALIVRASLRQLAVLEPRGTPLLEQGLDADFFRAQSAREDRAALAAIAGGLGWGAALALLGLIGQSLNPAQLGGPGPPLSPSAGLAGVTYLVCAVLLYSRARLGLLRASWRRDGIVVAPEVLRGWRWTSLAIVLAVAGIGLLLPQGYGAELVAGMQGGMLTLLNIFTLLALVLGVVAMGALGLALTIPALLLALLSGGGVGPAVPAGPLVLPPAPSVPPATPPTTLGPGIIFWLCMAALAAYAIWTVLRRQEWAIALGSRLRRGRLGRLLDWLARFWAGAASYARAVGESVGALLERPTASGGTSRSPRLRLRGLGPRGLVRACYAALLERAARGGLGRRRDETPYEYGAKLRTELPETANELDALTSAYVEAAYAPDEPTAAKAQRARGAWARLRKALRERRSA
jgi:hypothetical protein